MDKPLCFVATVTNAASAAMASDVVLLAFIGSKLPDSPRNPKLCDFQRVAGVHPGQSRSVLCVNSPLPALALVDAKGNERVVAGEYTVTVGVQGGVGGSGAGSAIGKAGGRGRLSDNNERAVVWSTVFFRDWQGIRNTRPAQGLMDLCEMGLARSHSVDSYCVRQAPPFDRAALRGDQCE